MMDEEIMIHGTTEVNEVVTMTEIDYTDSFSTLHDDLIRLNNNLLVLSALFAILVTFMIIKEFFNRR